MSNQFLVPKHSDPSKASDIKVLLSLIIDLYQPKKIFVFGSQANGTFSPTSDLDILILDPETSLSASRIHPEKTKLNIRLKCDLIVTTSLHAAAHSSNPEHIYTKALTEGVLVYEN